MAPDPPSFTWPVRMAIFGLVLFIALMGYVTVVLMETNAHLPG